MYDQEYKYDGFIMKIFPQYVKMLEPKDLWRLKKSVTENAFTTGRGRLSLKDTINQAQKDSNNDKNNYMLGLATAVRKDMSRLMYLIDDLYKSKRLEGHVVSTEGTYFAEEEFINENNELEYLDESKVKRNPVYDGIDLDEPYFKTNLKFKGARVVMDDRYVEEAKAHYPFVKNAFKNVTKNYPEVMDKITNELHNSYISDHGSTSLEAFRKEIYKFPLQNRIICTRDDYGCVFEFTFRISSLLDGRILRVIIKTDQDGLVYNYQYNIEKTLFSEFATEEELLNEGLLSRFRKSEEEKAESSKQKIEATIPDQLDFDIESSIKDGTFVQKVRRQAEWLIQNGHEKQVTKIIANAYWDAKKVILADLKIFRTGGEEKKYNKVFSGIAGLAYKYCSSTDLSKLKEDIPNSIEKANAIHTPSKSDETYRKAFSDYVDNYIKDVIHAQEVMRK